MSLNLLLKSGKTIFTPSDIGNILKIKNKNYLLVYINRMKKRGEITMLKKGLYTIQDNFNFFELANKLRTPSYVSLQSVLFQQGVIFQDYSNIITSISYNSFKTKLLNKNFIYHKMKISLLSNPKGVINDGLIKKASLERAIFDCFYIFGDYHLDNLKPVNKDLLFEIAKELDKKIYLKIKNLYA